MDSNLIIKNNEFPKFLNQLAIDLTNFYFKKLNKPFKVNNKLLGKGYDPVTTCDKAFETVSYTHLTLPTIRWV